MYVSLPYLEKLLHLSENVQGFFIFLVYKKEHQICCRKHEIWLLLLLHHHPPSFLIQPLLPLFPTLCIWLF
jgi:hypothetical protein